MVCKYNHLMHILICDYTLQRKNKVNLTVITLNPMSAHERIVK